MNKLIVEFNKFVEYGNEPTYTITYENPVFLINADGDEDSMHNIPNNQLNNIMNELINDFNDCKLEEYIKENKFKNTERILSIIATDYNVNNNSFYIDVNILGEPTKKEVDEIMNYIESQCSDGWGEGFEQTQIHGYNVSTWEIKGKRKIKHIKTKKVV